MGVWRVKKSRLRAGSYFDIEFSEFSEIKVKTGKKRESFS